MIEITPKELNTMLVGQIGSILSFLLPDGKKQGHEWVVGSLAGEGGKSMAVRMTGGKTGVWSDFATGDSGGDLLDLWSAVRQLSFVETLKQVKIYLGVKEDKPRFVKTKRHKKPPKPNLKKPSSEMLEWFAGRGISKTTVEKLKIAEKDEAICFPYFSPEGELELCKYRSLKDKKFWSNADPIPCLFGWQAIDDNHRNVVITEGELDAASFWQMGVAALSIPKGGGKGGKQDWINYEYDRLARFDEIYICMDNDEVGQDAKEEILTRLGQERCKVVELSNYKDANEVLVAGEDLHAFLDKAKTEDPEELRQLTDFHDEILKGLTTGFDDLPGMRLPWDKSFGEVKLRPSETTVWSGINSHGKSVLLSHVIVDGILQGERFCVASMELPPESFGGQLYSQAGWESRVDAALYEFVSDSLWVFNSYGTAKGRRILEVFRYANKRYGVTQFVIDSLAKCGFSEDDYSGQKAFVDLLVDFALEHRVHVHIVVHVRKGQGEEKIPGKFDIKGTGAIVDMASNAFIVWRNKEKESAIKEGGNFSKSDPDTILNCVKQRKTGVEPMYQLWFNPISRQYLGRMGDPDKRYLL